MKKSSAHRKPYIPFSIRTIYRWISRFYLGGMENLRNRKRTGRPRPGTDQHAAWTHATAVVQNPDQCQCAFAWWTAQQVRHALGAKFGRVLRRLPLPPPRPQRCATQAEPAHGQRWKNPEFPKLARRSPEWGDLLTCAERVRAHPEQPRSDPRRASVQRALPPPPAGSQQPGGPALLHGAGRPRHGGGLPGVPKADRGGSRPEDSVDSRQLQYSRCMDNPGVSGGEPSRSNTVFSADLHTTSQSGGTAMGFGQASVQSPDQ